jgi:hypothetical protein
MSAISKLYSHSASSASALQGRRCHQKKCACSTVQIWHVYYYLLGITFSVRPQRLVGGAAGGLVGLVEAKFRFGATSDLTIIITQSLRNLRNPLAPPNQLAMLGEQRYAPIPRAVFVRSRGVLDGQTRLPITVAVRSPWKSLKTASWCLRDGVSSSRNTAHYSRGLACQRGLWPRR